MKDSLKKQHPKEEDRSFSFGWDVELAPLFYNREYQHEVENRSALIRNDNEKCLSIVSDRYCPFYNHRFEGIVNSYLHVGSKSPHKQEFNGGGRLSVQLENNSIGSEALTAQILTDKGIKIDDQHKGLITMINGHDKKTPWLFGLTIIRIVCQNTFLLAMKDLNHSAIFTGKHLPHWEVKWEDMKATVESASQTMQSFMFDIEKLSNETWDPQRNTKFFEETFKVGGKIHSKKFENLLWNFNIHYNRYADQYGSDNKYAVFNAVTYMVDHNASKKQKERGWSEIGRGQDIKSRAFKLLNS